MNTYEVTYRDHDQRSEGLARIGAASRFEAGMALMEQATFTGVERRITGITMIGEGSE
jgi:hypothetical protein